MLPESRPSQVPMLKPIPCQRSSIRDAHRLIIQRQSGQLDHGSDSLTSSADVSGTPAPSLQSPPCKRPATDTQLTCGSAVTKARLATPQAFKRSSSVADLPAGGRERMPQPSSSSNLEQSQRPPAPPNRRRLRGQYRSDPDARAAHSKRMRADPIAVINRLRNIVPAEPVITPPVKAPDD